MVLFMDGVTCPLAGTLYSVCAGTVSHSRNLSGRRIDEFIWGHSMEEITAEQERSSNFYRSVLCCETMLSHYHLITQELILN